MGNPIVRPARLSDASSLAAIAIEVWVGTYLSEGVSGFFADYALSAHTPEVFEAAISDGKDPIFVSENATGIDGFARIDFDAPIPNGGTCRTEITTLYVQPRHHGKGKGRALLRAIAQECFGQDITSFWLATNSENTPAIAFYKALGFQAAGKTHFRLHDQMYQNDVFLMEDIVRLA